MLLLTTPRLLWGVGIEFLGARFSTEQRRSALFVLFGNWNFWVDPAIITGLQSTDRWEISFFERSFLVLISRTSGDRDRLFGASVCLSGMLIWIHKLFFAAD